ncbi:hypothetical protein D9611_011320 [Ephemerocybe angulata]|uniref:Uncharacterized protein n=1 Tax=Ephemerocybe angulata TaxID=980116 RepID=A0A8H5BBE1_9AGAR|nr:hypothetical protein D9611_011320 [Tulosesus angulatus]
MPVLANGLPALADDEAACESLAPVLPCALDGSSTPHSQIDTGLSASHPFPIPASVTSSSRPPRAFFDLQAAFVPSAQFPYVPPVFSNTVSEIQHLLHHHNIKFSLVLSLESCRDLLIRHLMSGACAAHPNAPPACQQFCGSHRSPLEISLDAFGLCTNSKMHIDHLERVVHALDFTEAPAPSTRPVSLRRQTASRVLKQYLDYLSNRPSNVPQDPDAILSSLDRESFKKRDLREVASLHGIHFVYQTTTDNLRDQIAKHICHGECVLGEGNAGCEYVVAMYRSGPVAPCQDDIRVGIFAAVAQASSVHPIRRVLGANEIPYKSSDTLRELRKELTKSTAKLREANRARGGRSVRTSTQILQQASSAKERWPELIPEQTKDQLVSHFRQVTSTAALQTFTCV